MKKYLEPEMNLTELLSCSALCVLSNIEEEGDVPGTGGTDNEDEV